MGNSHDVIEWRRRTKRRAVEYKGGKCQLCGYDKCMRALVFHHPSAKSFGLACGGITRAWEKLRKELDKCVLLCLNCHGEVHEGIASTDYLLEGGQAVRLRPVKTRIGGSNPSPPANHENRS